MAANKDPLTGNPPLTAPTDLGIYVAVAPWPAAREPAAINPAACEPAAINPAAYEPAAIKAAAIEPATSEDDSLSAGANRWWRLAAEHPLPALAVGVGLGWLAYESRRGGRFRGGNDPDLRGSLRHRARRARRSLGDLVAERPLAAGAATLALGLLAGLTLPATRREDEWMGGRRDELIAQFKQAGRDTLDKGKELTRDAVDRLAQEVGKQVPPPVTAGCGTVDLSPDTAPSSGPGGVSPEAAEWRGPSPDPGDARPRVM